MQKMRKNSLSPCYGNSNKENVSIQNMGTPLCISFRTLQQARKKKTLDHPTTQPAPNPKLSLNNYFIKQGNYSPIPQAQQKASETYRRDADKSIDEFRSSLKSKQKQMSSLNIQINTLNTTIGLLKQQSISMKQENKQIGSKNTELKKALKQKNQTIQKLRNKTQIPQIPSSSSFSSSSCCQSCHKHSQDYTQVIQKLNELQQVQNKLLQQNESLKKKQKMNKAMFKNLEILLQSNRLSQIKDLLYLLNQE